MQKTFKKILFAILLIAPSVSYAALDGVKGILVAVGSLMNRVIAIIFGLSLIYFFWGLSKFILHAGDPKTHEDGKKKMLWGIIALFVFLSIYGIISFLGNILGIRPNDLQNTGGEIPNPIYQGDVLPLGPDRA